MIQLSKENKKLLEELKSYSAEAYFHSVRVKSFTKNMLDLLIKNGEADYSQSEIESILMGSLFHDIGKIHVRNYILTKKDRLTVAEKTDIEAHTKKGAEELCKDLDGEKKEIVKNICLYHHERIDGGGYCGEKDIPLYVQVVSICDVYDALTSDRAYKGGMSSENAIGMIEEGKCGKFSEIMIQYLKKAV